jgi:hypothetical protein
MPISMTELIIGNLVLAAIVLGVIYLNRRKPGRGWIFLIGISALLIVGNFAEAMLLGNL